MITPTFTRSNDSRNTPDEPFTDSTKTADLTKIVKEKLAVHKPSSMQSMYDRSNYIPNAYIQECDEIRLINQAVWFHDLIIAVMHKFKQTDYHDSIQNALNALEFIKDLEDKANEIKAKLNLIVIICLYKTSGNTELIQDHINIIRPLQKYLDLNEFSNILWISSIFLSQKKYELALDDSIHALKVLDELQVLEENVEPFTDNEPAETTSAETSNLSSPVSSSSVSSSLISLEKGLELNPILQQSKKENLKAKLNYIAAFCLNKLEYEPDQFSKYLGVALALDSYLNCNENAELTMISSSLFFREGNYKEAFRSAVIGIQFKPRNELLLTLKEMKKTAKTHFNITKQLSSAKQALDNEKYTEAEKYASRGFSYLKKELGFSQVYASQFLLYLAKSKIGLRNYVSGEQSAREGLEIVLTPGINGFEPQATKDLMAELFFCLSLCLIENNKKSEAAKAYIQSLKFGKIVGESSSIAREMGRIIGLNPKLTEEKYSPFQNRSR